MNEYYTNSIHCRISIKTHGIRRYLSSARKFENTVPVHKFQNGSKKKEED